MKALLTLTAVLGLAIGVGVMSTDRLATAATNGDTAQATGLPTAAAFTATDTNGNEHSLADFAGQYVVLEWINDGCPFVKKFYNAGKMQELQETYTEQDVVWLAIASSAPGKQGHHDAAGWNAIIEDWNMAPTALLLDPSGEIGQAYDARTTPQMVIINPDGKIIYDGAIDSIRSSDADDISAAQNYVQTVLDAVLIESTEPYGCSVKY